MFTEPSNLSSVKKVEILANITETVFYHHQANVDKTERKEALECSKLYFIIND